MKALGSPRRGRRSAARRGRDQSLGLTILTGLVLLSVLGLIFSVAQGSKRITAAAGALHTTDETLRAATVARAQVALAGHLVLVDRELGTNSSAALELSTREARMGLTDYATGLRLLAAEAPSADPRLFAAAERFEGAVRTLLADIDAGSTHADELDLEAEFQAVVDPLVLLRNDLADEVAASDALLGRVGNVARFLVAFLVPAAIIIVYRGLMRRQARQQELENRLDSERQLNAAREMFIANASHELRTPLTSIVGLSMLLAEKPSVQEDDDTAETLDIVISEADDLSRMVEDLLTTARLDSGALTYSFEDVDVREEIEEIADTTRRAGLDVTWRCTPALVRADRLRLRQVLRNLVSNARKYGGPEICIDGRIDGRTYLCSVIDNGAGVPEEIAPNLFQRFIHQGHQTATKDSVGLGLSIVHALAQGMGGSITYDRIDGESHFSLRLPLADRALPAEPAGFSELPVGGALLSHATSLDRPAPSGDA